MDEANKNQWDILETEIKPAINKAMHLIFTNYAPIKVNIEECKVFAETIKSCLPDYIDAQCSCICSTAKKEAELSKELAKKAEK